jgi:hypothetical protein
VSRAAIGRYETIDFQLDECGDEEPAVTESGAGQRRRIPAFRRADGSWHVRYSSGLLGTHRLEADTGWTVTVDVEPYSGGNELLRHGPVRVAGRHLQHADGTPFLWLADTWWLALVDRPGWDAGFTTLACERQCEGFTAIQLVAGLYPEIGPFDEPGRGSGGFPWLESFADLNAAWWDAADMRIQALVDAGLMPVVVGAWGYYLDWLGVERMQRHWRTIIARWGALPVVWCLGGETNMPHYEIAFGPDAGRAAARLAAGWAQVAQYVRGVDPYARVLTTHPGPAVGQWRSSDGLPAGLFDLDLLQSGHDGTAALLKGLELVRTVRAEQPSRPVINGESVYEGIMGSNWADVQRLAFWMHMLGGAAGHSYGAHGLWAVDDGGFSGAPGVWGRSSWQDAARLPGASHMAVGARILSQLDWQHFEPHPEWIEPHATPAMPFWPCAAGTADGTRVFYIPSGSYTGLLDESTGRFVLQELTFTALAPRSAWRGDFIDPQSGDLRGTFELTVEPGADRATLASRGLSPCPSMEDWVIVLRPASR